MDNCHPGYFREFFLDFDVSTRGVNLNVHIFQFMGQGLLYLWVSEKHGNLLHVTTELMGSLPFHGWMDGLTCGLTHPSSCAEALQAGAEVPGRLGPVMWNWEDSVTWGRLPPGWYYLSLGPAQWRVACWSVMAWLDHGTAHPHAVSEMVPESIPTKLTPTQIECRT